MNDDAQVINDPPSPIKRHVKWKMTRTKPYGQMTSQAAQEISDKIMSWLFNFYYNYLNFGLIVCLCFTYNLDNIKLIVILSQTQITN